MARLYVKVTQLRPIMTTVAEAIPEPKVPGAGPSLSSMGAAAQALGYLLTVEPGSRRECPVLEKQWRVATTSPVWA